MIFGCPRPLVWTGLALWLACGTAGAQVVERFTAGDEFQIFGPTAASATAVRRIADGVIDWSERDLGLPKLRRPVVVRLVSLETDGPPDPPFGVDFEHGGQMRVRIPWNEYTDIEEVAQALVSGLLRQYAAQHGLPPPPVWLELAGSLEVQAELRPALLDGYAAEGREAGPVPIRDLLSLRGPFTPEALGRYRLQSFWLARYLAQWHDNRRTARELWQRVLAGQTVASILALNGAEWAKDPVLLEREWAVGYTNLVRGRRAPAGSLGDALENLRRLATVVVWDGERDVRLIGSQIWARRDDERVQAALKEQLRRLKVEVLAVNPVYRNAYVALGSAYEAVLAEDAATFEAALATFFEEARAARQLKDDIERLLDW